MSEGSSDGRGYVAHLGSAPDAVLDRMGMRAVADAMLFMEDLRVIGVPAARSEPGRVFDIAHQLMDVSYGWTRPRRVKALLAMDALLDHAAGRPEEETVEDVEAALALIGPVTACDGGYSCRYTIPLDRLAAMVERGVATVVPPRG